MKKQISPLLLAALAVSGVWTSPLAQAQPEAPPTPEAPPPGGPPSEPPLAAAPDEVPPPRHAQGRLEVQLFDAATGAPIAGATVMVDGDAGGESDAEGRVSLGPLAVGPHNLLVMSAAHDTLDTQTRVHSGGATHVRYRLAAATAEVYEIAAKDARPRREATEVVLSEAEFKTVPGTLGDPVRVVENLPGMNRTPGGLGGALIVRGANPADSGVYVDGVEIPLLYHFGGLTSVVSGEFMGGITFTPGGFGPQFGRATAGIVNVETKPLSCTQLRALAAVDPIDAEMFACAPVGSWKLALAGRRSYVDAFLPALLEASSNPGESPTVIAPAYFDYQAKAENTSARTRWEIFAFGANDTLKVTRATSAEDADLSLGGGIQFHRLQVRHTHFGDRVTLESALVPGFLRQDFGSRSADLDRQHHSKVDMFTLQGRENLTVRVSEHLALRAGLDHQLYTWQADFITDLPNLARQFPNPLGVDPQRQIPWKKSSFDSNLGFWTELVTSPATGITLTPGVRVDRFDFANRAQWAVDPRLATRWQVNEPTALKASGGVYRKLPDLFSGVMVPGFGQPGLLAERAIHLTSGIERRFSPLDVTLEGFHVWRSRLPSPTDAVTFRDGKAEPVLFESEGRGRSYGLELLLKRNPTEGRRFSGWVAYTLSRSTRTDRTPDAQGLGGYAGVDPGAARLFELPATARTYLSPFDQTHIFTTVGSWQLPWKMTLGFRVQVVSGNPTTPLENGRSTYDADGDIYRVAPGSVARNSARLPAFQRVDLRLDKRWDFHGWNLTAYLEVMNASNRRAVEAIDYDYRFANRTELRGLPLLPLLGVKGEI
ncbi:MAG: TonB-dependent receptor [Myxococcales bacterium]|nr:TonB-dependent receptor [Myxococcales bacterium]